jgi:hypothetical protein
MFSSLRWSVGSCLLASLIVVSGCGIGGPSEDTAKKADAADPGQRSQMPESGVIQPRVPEMGGQGGPGLGKVDVEPDRKNREFDPTRPPNVP